MKNHGFEGVPPHILDAWRSTQVDRPLADPGPEWLSLNQLTVLWGLSKGRACARLRTLGEQVERSKRQIINARGYRQAINVYRLRPIKKRRKS